MLNEKIEYLKSCDLNCNVFSVYDYDGYTMQELLCQFFTRINECIKVSNQTIDLVEWLVNQGLKEEVAKKLEIWLTDGTLATIINETIFKELNSKIKLIDNFRVHIKNFVSNYEGKEDVSLGFNKAFEFIENMQTSTISLPWDAKTKGKIVLDLDNGRYLLSHKVVISPNQMSSITIENGTIVIGEGVDDAYIFEVGNGGHSYQNILKNICFVGNKKTKGIFLKDTLNTQIKDCFFIDIPVPVDSDTNCHETFLDSNYFLWTDYQNTKGNKCIRVGADSHITNNIGVGFDIGVECFSNANLITHNHFYSMGEWGVQTVGNSLGNIINNNYFDGCSLNLYMGGYMDSVSNNLFIAQNKYASVYLSRTNLNQWLQNFSMQGNTIIPYNEFTPVKRPNFIMEDGTITVTNDVELTENMVGGILTDFYKDNIGQIIKVLSNKKAIVKIFNGLSNNTYNSFYINPTNVCAYSNDFEWSNVVHDTLYISQNRIDSGHEIVSGNINGVLKRMDRQTASIGEIIERQYIEKTANFSGDVLVNFSKKPSFLQVYCLVEGDTGSSNGTIKLTPNGQIENICYYNIQTSGNNLSLKYRLDYQCGCVVNSNDQAININCVEMGNDYIKINIDSKSSDSARKLKIDLFAF